MLEVLKYATQNLETFVACSCILGGVGHYGVEAIKAIMSPFNKCCCECTRSNSLEIDLDED